MPSIYGFYKNIKEAKKKKRKVLFGKIAAAYDINNGIVVKHVARGFGVDVKEYPYMVYTGRI